MLNKATLDAIAKAIGVEVEVLTTGISSEDEVNIEVKPAKPNQFTDDELAALKDNLSKEGYDRGAQASREMTLKDLSKAAGLDETIKDASKFIDNYKAKILEQAKASPNERISELETSIEKLQNTIKEKDADYVKLQDEFTMKERVSKVGSFLPDLKETIGLNRDEVVNLFMSTHEITDDGIKRNGQIIKDQVENPLGLDKVVESWIGERGWKSQPTGRGGGSGKPAGTSLPASMAEYESYIAEKGYPRGSAEANAVLSDMIKENPDIGD